MPSIIKPVNKNQEGQESSDSNSSFLGGLFHKNLAPEAITRQ